MRALGGHGGGKARVLGSQHGDERLCDLAIRLHPRPLALDHAGTTGGRGGLDPLGPLRSEGDDARGLALHRLGDGR